MKENYIYNIKYYKNLILIVKKKLDKSKKKYYNINFRELNKNKKEVRKRRKSDLDSIYKNFLNQKRKNSN